MHLRPSALPDLHSGNAEMTAANKAVTQDVYHSVTYKQRSLRPKVFWKGAICHILASHFGEHWRHSQGVQLGI